MTHKLIYTDQGLNLAKETQQDLQVEMQIEKQKKLAEQQRKKTLLDQSVSHIDALLKDTNVSLMSNQIAKKVSLASSNQRNSKANIIQLFNEEINQNKNTYIQKQIVKYTNKLMTPQSNKNFANYYVSPSINQPSKQQQSSIFNSNTVNMSQTAEESGYMDKYNQILITESKIEKMFKRHTEYQKKTAELRKKIDNIYQQRQSNLDLAQLKTNKLKDEVRRENSDLIDVLMKETQYKKRLADRHIDVMNQRYSYAWNNYYFPKLTKKYELIQAERMRIRELQDD